MAGEQIRVKICGLNHETDIEAALSAGADYVGFVFFPPSPRHMSLAKGRDLAKLVKNAQKVTLTVDADDRKLEQIIEAVDPDLLQLHGKESPQRAREINQKFGISVMKAIGISQSKDLKCMEGYRESVSQFLIDAKPAPGHQVLPGGNGIAFDWRILDQWHSDREWMLAGGLTAANVRQAIELTGARIVDVSSGVETSPGRKCPQQIAAFIHAAKGNKHEQ